MGPVRGRGLAGVGPVRGWGLAGAGRGGAGRGRGLDSRLPAALADCGAQDETWSLVCSTLHRQSLRLGVETADPQFPALQLSPPLGKALGASFFFSSQKQNFGMGKQSKSGEIPPPPSGPFWEEYFWGALWRGNPRSHAEKFHTLVV